MINYKKFCQNILDMMNLKFDHAMYWPLYDKDHENVEVLYILNFTNESNPEALRAFHYKRDEIDQRLNRVGVCWIKIEMNMPQWQFFKKDGLTFITGEEE